MRDAVEAEHVVRISQPRPCQRVLRVQCNRPFEAFHGCQEPWAPLKEEPAASYERLEGLDVLRTAPDERLRLRVESDFQALCNGMRDLFLNGEKILWLTVILSRPKMVPISYVDELSSDTKSVT